MERKKDNHDFIRNRQFDRGVNAAMSLIVKVDGMGLFIFGVESVPFSKIQWID